MESARFHIYSGRNRKRLSGLTGYSNTDTQICVGHQADFNNNVTLLIITFRGVKLSALGTGFGAVDEAVDAL